MIGACGAKRRGRLYRKDGDGNGTDGRGGEEGRIRGGWTLGEQMLERREEV